MDEQVIVDRNGIRLVATARGSGEPVVFLHGLGFTGASWSAVVDRLAIDHRCITPDQRGYGGSAGDPDADWAVLCDDLAAWVGMCRVPPLVVGHSWGAKIALVAAASGLACRGVYCVDGAVVDHGGSLSEELYQDITVPVSMVFASRSAREQPQWPFTPASVEALAERHPALLVTWADAGHDMLSETPAYVADQIRLFGRSLT